MNGHGCAKCHWENNDKRWNLDKPTTLYYARIIDEDHGIFYKIGITTRPIEKRFSVGELECMQILWSKQFDNGHDAYKVEQAILRRYYEYRSFIKIPSIRAGHYELFTRDVLESLDLPYNYV